ncbi:MAG: hypothetical protein RQ743_14545, partial [Bacteroidales bacterium]|nr:hypothetical protein [Bacteroidales bacterium]
MKAYKPGSRRRKIVLYFLLAVVLPGIILGYMAFRGMRNDQALREKESRQKLEINSQAFFTEIDSGFISLVNEMTDDSLHPVNGTVDPSVLAYYIIDSSGSKKLVGHKLLYVPVELMPEGDVVAEPHAGLAEGQRLEFAEKRYVEALRFYSKMALNDNDIDDKIQALVAAARLYNKMNQPEQAKSLYEEIWKDYSGRLLNGQIPLELIAGLEILKINRDLGQKDEMRINSLKCLELMLHPCSEYDRDQFEMFYRSFQEIISERDPLIDSLLMELDNKKARTDYLIRLLSEPDLTENSVNGFSVTAFNSNELAAVYLTWEKNNGVPAGMVIDFPAYLRSISDRLIGKMDPDSMLSVKILDRNDSVVLSRAISEETVYLSFPFPESLPQWKLLLSENRPGFLATLMKAGS